MSTLTKDPKHANKTTEQLLNELADFLSRLADRWQDEAGCEDFADYQKVMKESVEKRGFAFCELTAYPMKLRLQDVAGSTEYALAVHPTKVTIDGYEISPNGVDVMLTFEQYCESFKRYAVADFEKHQDEHGLRLDNVLTYDDDGEQPYPTHIWASPYGGYFEEYAEPITTTRTKEDGTKEVTEHSVYMAMVCRSDFYGKDKIFAALATWYTQESDLGISGDFEKVRIW